MDAEELTCAGCGRRGLPADVATGWSLATRPRPTGAQSGATGPVTAHCPDCLRRGIRDVEGRLDP
ncbi:hypothetical protein ACU610_15320 [Geodermatophilus sp. URMC 61]|uniref:hypothetical protein n=1 Tax=Geodermatophilus sp. URMC 61 TaxID=3423411 RepID=UPI00406C1D05